MCRISDDVEEIRAIELAPMFAALRYVRTVDLEQPRKFGRPQSLHLPTIKDTGETRVSYPTGRAGGRRIQCTSWVTRAR